MRTASISRNIKRSFNFNMLEVTVTMVIAVVGVVGLVGLFPVGLEQNRQAIGQSYASDAAEQFLHFSASKVRDNWDWVNAFPDEKPADEAAELGKTWSNDSLLENTNVQIAFSTYTTTSSGNNNQSVCGETEVKINPGNGNNGQFCLTTPSGVITRDQLADGTVVEYNGEASECSLKPTGNGNQNYVTIDGIPFFLANGASVTLSGDMYVNVYNQSEPDGNGNLPMGDWWICIGGTDVTITEIGSTCENGTFAGIEDVFGDFDPAVHQDGLFLMTHQSEAITEFKAVIRGWKEITEFDDGSKKVRLNAEISWPADLPYGLRSVDTYDLTLFKKADMTIDMESVLPSANPDSYTVSEGFLLNVAAANGVLNNDTDVLDRPLTAALVEDAQNGTLVLSSNGSFVYTPDANYNGADTFTYVASNGMNNSEAVTVTVAVTPVNVAPFAAADSYSVDEDNTLVVSASGVLGNDTDADGNALFVVMPVVSDVSNGTLVPFENGAFTYIPNANFSGTDSFDYKVFDGEYDSNVATVTITVNPVNECPVWPITAQVINNRTTGVYFCVNPPGGKANDVESGQSLTYTLTDLNAINGDWAYVTNNRQIAGTPVAEGTFTYILTASDGECSVDANVTILVTGGNDAPVAVTDSYGVDQGGSIAISAGNGVLGNDTDADGDSLVAVLVDNASNGTLILTADGGFSYTPAADFNGTDSFTYRASDGSSLSTEAATVSITVNPFTIVDDEVITTPDECSVTIQVLGAAVSYSGLYEVPVTVQVNAGATSVQPWGDVMSPTGADINDGNNPRSYTIPGTVPAGTAITTTCRAWLKNSTSLSGDVDSDWYLYKTVSPGTANTVVLKNGDAVPQIAGFLDQAAIIDFLTGFVDADGKMSLPANQAIYLFEYNDSQSSSAWDLQDTVVLVTLTPVDNG